MKQIIRKRYWKYILTGNIFPKPEYWEPIHEGWAEVSRAEYEDFALGKGWL